VWSDPDVERARDLIEDADAIGEKVTVWASDQDVSGNVRTMRYVVEVLRDIGLRAKLTIVHDLDEYAGAVFTGEAQAYLFGWLADYPSPTNFIELLFACGEPLNASGLCSESLDARIEEAKRLQATDPAASNRVWIEIEHQLVADAVWAPLTNPIFVYAFSARTENIQVNPQWGVLLSRLWVQ